MSELNGQQPQDQLPDGWRLAKLGDVSRVVSGSTPQTGVNEYWSGDIIWVTPTDLGKHKEATITNSARQITENGYKSCGAEIVPAGAIIMSSRAPIGHLAIAGVPLCTNQGCKSFVVNSDCDANFLYFALKRSVPALQDLGSGATFAEVSKSQLANFSIPIPPLGEQKRIAAILTEQMAAVEKARAATEAQLQAAKALPAAYLRDVFESVEAKQWPNKRLDEISRLIAGGTPSRRSKASFEGSIPWVKTLDLNCGLVESTEESISDAAFSEIRGELLPVGTVMVAMYGGAGTIGKSGILGIPAVTNQAVCSLLPNPDVFDSVFLHNWLKLIRPQWMKFSGGNRKDPNINKGVVAQMRCPLPDVQTQRHASHVLAQKLATVDKVTQALRDQLITIQKTPAALLRQAFAGEL